MYFLMKLNKWIDGKVENMRVFHFVNPTKTLVAMATCSFHWLIMRKSGSYNNLKTACSILMKLATWIDSRMEMHILLLCLPNINFGYYGNLKLPFVDNGKMRILQ